MPITPVSWGPTPLTLWLLHSGAQLHTQTHTYRYAYLKINVKIYWLQFIKLNSIAHT